ETHCEPLTVFGKRLHLTIHLTSAKLKADLRHPSFSIGYLKIGFSLRAQRLIASASSDGSGVNCFASPKAILKSVSSPGGRAAVIGWDSVNLSPFIASDESDNGSYQHLEKVLVAPLGQGCFAMALSARMPISFC